jgi:hypothetical protein
MNVWLGLSLTGFDLDGHLEIARQCFVVTLQQLPNFFPQKTILSFCNANKP